MTRNSEFEGGYDILGLSGVENAETKRTRAEVRQAVREMVQAGPHIVCPCCGQTTDQFPTFCQAHE